MSPESSATSVADTTAIQFAGVHHVTLRVQDPEATKRFWGNIFGAQFMELPVSGETTRIWRGAPAQGALLATQVGSTFVVFAPPLEGVGTSARFEEQNLGLDHIAFGVQDPAELDRLVTRLNGAGVANAGVELDPVLGKNYVCFRDPDNIQIEAFVI